MLSFPNKPKHCSKDFIETIGEALVNWPYSCSALKKIRRRNASRELAVQAGPERKRSLEERVWDIANFRILYRLNGAKSLIEVGVIRRVR